MKFNPFIWGVMTQRMKPGLKKVWNGDVKTLIIDARPIYRELLSKVEGISDGNPMASNITMSFVIIAVWLASDRKIPPSEMSKVSDLCPGREYLKLEPRMKLVSERSYNDEMKKYSIRGKLFAIIGKNLNNRLAVYEW